MYQTTKVRIKLQGSIGQEDIIFWLDADQPNPGRTLLSTRMRWTPVESESTTMGLERGIKWLTMLAKNCKWSSLGMEVEA